MPFIDQGTDFADSKERTPVPDGPYDLTITDEKYVAEKHYIIVTVGFDNPPDDIENPKPWVNFLNLTTNPDDPEETKKTKGLFTKRFLHMFGIPYVGNGFNTDDLRGASAKSVMVKSTVYKKNPEDEGQHQYDVSIPEVPPEDMVEYEGRSSRGSGRRRRR